MRIHFGGLALLAMMAVSLPAWAAETPYKSLGPELEYFKTPHGAHDIESIAKQAVSDLFQPVSDDAIALGYTGGSDHWFRFQLPPPGSGGWRVLEFSNPRLGEVALYRPNTDGTYTAFALGVRRPFWDRHVASLSPAFPLNLDEIGPQPCYVRIRHLGSLRFEARLWDWDAYNRHSATLIALSLLLSGGLLALALYHIAVFVNIRQWGYLWIGFFLVACNLNLMVTSGTASMLLWPEPTLLARRSMTLTSLMALLVGIELCNYLLKEAPNARVFAWANRAAGALALAGAALTFVGYPAAFYLTFVGALLAPASVTAMALAAVRAGQRNAIGFLVCWGFVLLGVILICLMGPGYIDASRFTEHFVFVAVFAATIGWSYTLTRQIKEQEARRREALEHEVESRTAALREAVNEVKELHELLPICCSCKKIRDDDGFWQHVETYLQAHTTADLSHGLCPECAGNLYPDYFPARETDKKDDS